MYCSVCGSALAPGLSFCNRCGMSLKERESSKSDPIGAYLTAIAILAVAGVVFMLGGAIALKNGANFENDIIGIFMLMTFSIVAMVEIFLCRQLSRLNRSTERTQSLPPQQQTVMPAELRAAQLRTLGEPVQSVTENTTRTLEYSRSEPFEN